MNFIQVGDGRTAQLDWRELESLKRLVHSLASLLAGEHAVSQADLTVLDNYMGLIEVEKDLPQSTVVTMAVFVCMVAKGYWGANMNNQDEQRRIVVRGIGDLVRGINRIIPYSGILPA